MFSEGVHESRADERPRGKSVNLHESARECAGVDGGSTRGTGFARGRDESSESESESGSDSESESESEGEGDGGSKGESEGMTADGDEQTDLIAGVLALSIAGVESAAAPAITGSATPTSDSATHEVSEDAS